MSSRVSGSARPPSTPRKAGRPRARGAWSGSTRLGRGIASRRLRILDAARKPVVAGPPTEERPMVDRLPRCPGPERISRREMLVVSGAGLLGLSLPGLLRAEADAREWDAGLSSRADACIVVFLNGGPSHLDMWD